MYSKVKITRAQVDGVRAHQFGERPPEYQQKLWFFKSGSPYPIEVEIRLPSGITFYEEGDYIIDTQSNYAAGKYGDLSFAPFCSFSLIKVDEAMHEAIDKLENQFNETLRKFLSPPAVAAVPAQAKG